MKFAFQNPKFVATATTPSQLPYLGTLPHVAVVGRSNVGKSSLLNALFKTKQLVKTSSTPGKTQAIHFFSVDNKLLFADLPGYGYAEAPLEAKAGWSEVIEAYLATPPHLVLFLLDIRRTPQAHDLSMMEWLAAERLPLLLVLTKSDKVTSGERLKQTNLILDHLMEGYHRFSPHTPPHLHTSSLTQEGRQLLIHKICEKLP